MRKLIVGKNDLLFVKPDVALDWDEENNNGLKAFEVSAHSGRKVNWKCQYCGRPWTGTINNHRVPGCKTCHSRTNHKTRIKRSIIANGSLEQYKELMLDWDKEANEKAGYFSNEMTIQSNEPVNWKCHKCGYKWQREVANRVNGNGCPACAHRVLFEGHNDLKTLYPELALEWNEKKNGIPANKVIGGGITRYSWKCLFCGNEFTTSIHNRIAGTMCSRCQGASTSFAEQAIYYYIKQMFPNAVNRYIDPETEKELDIYIPDLRIGVEYDGYRFHSVLQTEDDEKNRLFNEQGIKLIRVRETDYNGTRLPQLSVKIYKTFVYKKNTRYTGLDSIIEQLVNLISDNDSDIIPNTYDDRFTILHTMYLGQKKNSFQTNNHNHLKYWDSERNAPLLPTEISSHSGISVYWKCDICGYKWERTIDAEVKSKGCPACNRQVLSEKYNFAVLHPDIAAEWDYDRNPDTPFDVFPYTHETRFWICKKCGNRYPASIDHRSYGTGCRKCGLEKNRHSRMKPVLQIDKITNKVIATYPSAREAEKQTGVSFSKISMCCNGKNQTAGGYKWKFNITNDS